MPLVSARRSFTRLGSDRSVTAVPLTRRETVASGRAPSSRSSVRRIGDAFTGSVNREIGGVCTVFTARLKLYRRSRYSVPARLRSRNR
jgi:hypothetical protein